MLTVRRAEAMESGLLTGIACDSEAYWGYDETFMERFKSLYRVTEEFIKENPTFVMEEDGEAIGFFSIIIEQEEKSLEYFYIKPGYIGKGYGKALWQYMVGVCEQLGVEELALVTSPQAQEFYIKMGAVLTGEVDSLVVEGRRIPRLVYKPAKRYP